MSSGSGRSSEKDSNDSSKEKALKRAGLTTARKCIQLDVSPPQKERNGSPLTSNHTLNSNSKPGNHNLVTLFLSDPNPTTTLREEGGLLTINGISPENYKSDENLNIQNNNNHHHDLDSFRSQTESDAKEWVTPMISEEEIKISDKDATLLGKGSYGFVYKGNLRGTEVAVKALKIKVENLIQFKREINIMTLIRHPNIILFLGACEDPPYIVTELLTGGDLQHLIVKNNKLIQEKKESPNMTELINLAIDIARGMAWLHNSIPPIIHKDLKPSNIMLDGKGTAKIIDFGLSEVQKQKEMEHRQGAGSLTWMAPEMIVGKTYNEKIDVYAYGIILWQLFTSTPEVYDSNSYSKYPPSIAKDKFKSDIVDFNMRPVIPASFQSKNGKLCNLIEEAWDKDPAKRPSFQNILSPLSQCLISYALNDDAGAINMWTKFFSEKKTKISLHDLISALWRTVYDREPPDPEDDTYISVKCIEAVINPPNWKQDLEVSLYRFGNFVHWYGPLLPASRGETIFQKLESLLRSEWYHGEINGPTAEGILKAKHPCDYLIRCSFNLSAPFTMTRMTKEAQLVHHRIYYNRSTGVYKMQFHQNKKDCEITGSTLPEFVKHAIRTLGLKSPAKCTTFQQIFQKQKATSIGYEVALIH